MSFKGTPNRKGRPKNALNKSTKTIKNAFSLLVEENLDLLKEDIKSMKSSERVTAILQISKYLIPTLKAVELDASIDVENDNNDLINRLLNIPDSNFEKVYKNG